MADRFRATWPVLLAGLLPLIAAAQIDTAWVRRYNGIYNGYDVAMAMVVDQAGFAHVAGYSADTSGERADILTLKYYPNGDTVWTRRWAGAAGGDDYGRYIALGPDGSVYIAGQTTVAGQGRDVIVLKYTPDGSLAWTRTHAAPGTYDDEVAGIVADKLGGVYVTGTERDPVSYYDWFTIKYNANGDSLWTRRFNGTGNNYDNASGMLLDTAGFCYVTGLSYDTGNARSCVVQKYTPNGSLVWTGRYPGYMNGGPRGLALDGFGNVAISGQGNLGTDDHITVKFGPTGALRWMRSYDGPQRGNDGSYGVGFDAAGNVYETGWIEERLYQPYDFCTVKYDSSGNQQWVRIWGGSGTFDCPRDITVDSAGNSFITGRGGNYYGDYVTMKYTAMGDLAWVKQYNGRTSNEDDAVAIAVLGADVYVTGMADQYEDIVTIKYSPPGNHDVGTAALLAPRGTIDSNTVVVPACTVANYGNRYENFTVRLRVGNCYNQTAAVNVLAPGSRVLVTFPGFAAWPRGTHTVTCSTQLVLDTAVSNNRATASLTVNVRNAASAALLAPRGTIDSAGALVPACSTRNTGTLSADYSVRLRVGAFYDQRVDITGHAPGASRYVTFPAHAAWPRGTHAVVCSTELTGDLVPADDRLSSQLDVRVRDVATAAIIRPASTELPGVTFYPQARFRNPGSTTEMIDLFFAIPEAGYQDQEQWTLAPGGEQVIGFTGLQLANGSYTARAWAAIAGDLNRRNDTLTLVFQVGTPDAAVRRIPAPAGEYDSSAVIIPAAWVGNTGAVSLSGSAVFRLLDSAGRDVYQQAVSLAGLVPGDSRLVTFPDWPGPHAAGRYTGRCSVAVAGDAQPANDTLGTAFTITAAPAETGWVRKADLPAGARNRRVKDGGALACSEQSDSSFVYALKGNNTLEFYAYDRAGDEWTALESVPAIGSSGRKKTVKKGAALTAGAGRVYAVKGNGTLEFWSFEPAGSRQETGDRGRIRNSSLPTASCLLSTSSSYPWTQLADVPAGTKTIKEGAGAVTLSRGDTTCIYLLKGSATVEFYCYNTLTGTWTTRADAPIGISNKTWKNGSALAAGSDGRTIYALKAGYNEFYAYDVDSDRWTTGASLPLAGSGGRKKKVKDGAGLACGGARIAECGVEDGGQLFALKGGNTDEFWSYRVDGDSWVQRAGIPLGSGRSVRDGGALVSTGDALYALKGNNSLDFFKYGFSTYSSQLAAHSPEASVQSSLFNHQSSLFNLRAAPNPFSGATTVAFTLPRAGNISLKLYDATGRRVATLDEGLRPAGRYSVPVNAARLVRGSYMLQLSVHGATTTQRLIVE